MRLVEGETGTWSTVTDVHGAPGTSGWRQLNPGRTLRGPWEAVELARLSPGGVSGRHRHTRTNEIYFVLRGECELDLNGEPSALKPGGLALVTAGSTHGLRNTGERDFHWLVVEVPAARPHPTSASESPDMSPRLQPIDLSAAAHVDLAGYGAAPLLDAALARLEPAETLELSAEGCEIFGYLVSGTAVITAADREYTLDEGTGVALTLGESARLRPVTPCEFFHVRSAAEGPVR